MADLMFVLLTLAFFGLTAWFIEGLAMLDGRSDDP